MPKPLAPEVKRLLKKHELDPREALWDCHGTWVMYHKYIELIAVKEGVEMDIPSVIRNDGQDVCILVHGKIPKTDNTKTLKEWSFGEASPKNNKNAYPFAMAEKRAKDRVILKLVGLSGHVYSDVDVADPNSRTPFAVNS